MRNGLSSIDWCHCGSVYYSTLTKQGSFYLSVSFPLGRYLDAYITFFSFLPSSRITDPFHKPFDKVHMHACACSCAVGQLGHNQSSRIEEWEEIALEMNIFPCVLLAYSLCRAIRLPRLILDGNSPLIARCHYVGDRCVCYFSCKVI